MDKTRKQGIEDLMRKYYKAYDVLADLPEEVIRRLSTLTPNTNSLKDKITIDAMRTIATVEPFIEPLSFAEYEFMTELYGSDEHKRGQADRIADDKGISRRSVFNQKNTILRKLDSLLPEKFTDEEKATLFTKRWHR